MKEIFLILFLVLGMHSSFAEEENERPNIEIFQDWIVNCNSENKLCIGNQTIRTEKGLPVALINITHVDENTILEFGLPLMLNLKEGITVEIDNNIFASYDFNVCSGSACFVITKNNTALINSFKSGSEAKVKARTIYGETLNLKFSLLAFSRSLEELISRNRI